ncbi:MAG: YkgJ family cysteine cluster protein [Myxococcota bacterium]
MSDASERALLALPVLYENIDGRVGHLESKHQERLHCTKGCAQCCTDDLSVQEVEAAHIIRSVGDRLRGSEPGPTGGCAFLDTNDACRIYEARPYVCRTQGLPLRWIEGSTERRDICPLNEAGPPIEKLEAESCWTLGPVEDRLGLLQSLRPETERISLRALFERLR